MIVVASPTTNADRYALTFPKIGGKLFVLDKPVIDLYDRAHLKEIVLKEDASAVVIDYTAAGLDTIGSYVGTVLAEWFYHRNVATFFLTSRPRHEGGHQQYPHRTRLIEAMKWVETPAGTYRIMSEVGVFEGKLFMTATGEPVETSLGDGGWDQVQHLLRECIAYWNYDWPAIFKKIEECLATNKAPVVA